MQTVLWDNDLYTDASSARSTRFAASSDLSFTSGSVPENEKYDLQTPNAYALNRALDYPLSWNENGSRLLLDEDTVRYEEIAAAFRGNKVVGAHRITPHTLDTTYDPSPLFSIHNDHYTNVASEAARGYHGISSVTKSIFTEKEKPIGAQDNMRASGYERHHAANVKNPELPTSLTFNQVEPNVNTIDMNNLNQVAVPDYIPTFPLNSF